MRTIEILKETSFLLTPFMIAAIVWTISLSGSISAAPWPQQSAAELVRTVAIKLADGRVMRCSTDAQPLGSGWTPIVPRIPGMPTSRDGLELSALDHACGRQAGDLT